MPNVLRVDEAQPERSFSHLSRFVVAYDKSRATPGLFGVDIGFAMVDRSIVATIAMGRTRAVR